MRPVSGMKWLGRGPRTHRFQRPHPKTMAHATAITLSHEIGAEIIAHAQADAPQEVCGILSGRDGVATELVRARNEAANPIMEYWVDGQTLLKQFDFEARGEQMIAIYHSHPVDEAFPSAADAAGALYPDAIYLICSLRRPDAPKLRAFRLLQSDLAGRPGGCSPVRGDPRLLARLHRQGHDLFYDLVVTDRSGAERWLRVQVVEVPVIIDDGPMGCALT